MSDDNEHGAGGGNDDDHQPLTIKKKTLKRTISAILAGSTSNSPTLKKGALSSSSTTSLTSISRPTQLHHGIKQQYPIAKLSKLIKKATDVNELNADLQTPLHTACSYGNSEIITLLLRKGAHINVRDMNGWTPLHFCVCENTLEVCLLLLGVKDIDVTIKNNEQTSVLHYMVRRSTTPEEVEQYYHVLDILLEKGIDINVQNKHGEAPLHSACMKGNIDAIRYLLERKADPNLQSLLGDTSLHYAVQIHNPRIVELLMAHSADPTRARSDKATAVDIAAQSQQLEVLEIISSYLEREMSEMSDKQLQMQASTTNLFGPPATPAPVQAHRPRSRSQKKRGFLMICDGRTWYKQLSVLRNGVLYCYERKGADDAALAASTSDSTSTSSNARKMMRSESEVFEEKCYVVRECCAVDEPPVPPEMRLYCFSILTGIGDISAAKTVYLGTDSAEDRLDWLRKLGRAGTDSSATASERFSIVYERLKTLQTPLNQKRSEARAQSFAKILKGTKLLMTALLPPAESDVESDYSVVGTAGGGDATDADTDSEIFGASPAPDSSTSTHSETESSLREGADEDDDSPPVTPKTPKTPASPKSASQPYDPLLGHGTPSFVIARRREVVSARNVIVHNAEAAAARTQQPGEGNGSPRAGEFSRAPGARSNPYDGYSTSESLRSLLLSNTQEIVAAMCELVSPDDDEFIQSLVTFCSSQPHLMLVVLKAAIKHEIYQRTSHATLFREMSLATKLFAFYTHHHVGREYLKATVQVLVEQVLAIPHSLEINPARAQKGTDVRANADIILSLAQVFIDKLQTTMVLCPLELREALTHAKVLVSELYPQMRQAVVGCFIFLRFFCPAIVSPHTAGIIDSPVPNQAMSALVLLSKLFQALASGVEFDGTKEEHMLRLNPFIQKNQLVVRIYLDNLTSDEEIAKARPSGPAAADSVYFHPSSTEVVQSLAYMCRYLVSRRSKMEDVVRLSANAPVPRSRSRRKRSDSSSKHQHTRSKSSQLVNKNV